MYIIKKYTFHLLFSAKEKKKKHSDFEVVVQVDNIDS